MGRRTSGFIKKVKQKMEEEFFTRFINEDDDLDDTTWDEDADSDTDTEEEDGDTLPDEGGDDASSDDDEEPIEEDE